MGLIADQRAAFHKMLIDADIVTIDDQGIASIADRSQRTSRIVAGVIAESLGAQTRPKGAGQRAGSRFEFAVQRFLKDTFPYLGTLRPGAWTIEDVGGSRGEYHLARYEPYRHLDDLARAVEADPTLRAVLGNSYSISPDVLITRSPESDDVINRESNLVDPDTARRSIIRNANQPHRIVHAVVSCKLTLRSDRAQNARSEALSIIRNRKGRSPHIVVVTAEPSPSRIASLALGTGDLDMVYHIALPELVEGVRASGSDEGLSMLESLIDGERLRDIADLPLDLCI